MSDTNNIKCTSCTSETEWTPIHRFCVECGAELVRPAPTPEMTYDERLAWELDNAYLSRARISLPPPVGAIAKKKQLDFLARARELLGPAAEAKGRREAFESTAHMLSKMWHSCRQDASPKNELDSAYVWVLEQLDACGPAKAAVTDDVYSKAATDAIREVERLKAKHLADLSAANKAMLDVLAERDDLRAQAKYLESEAATQMRRGYELEREVKVLRAKLAEAKRIDGAHFNEVVSLRNEKRDLVETIERLTRELAEAKEAADRLADCVSPWSRVFTDDPATTFSDVVDAAVEAVKRLDEDKCSVARKLEEAQKPCTPKQVAIGEWVWIETDDDCNTRLQVSAFYTVGTHRFFFCDVNGKRMGPYFLDGSDDRWKPGDAKGAE